MKLINSSVIVKEQESGIDGVYKQIEWADVIVIKVLIR